MARRSDNTIELLLLLGGGSYLAWKYLVPGVQRVGTVAVDASQAVIKALPGGSGPRGVRNNNPGNIEYSIVNPWQGQTGSDGRFSIFSSPVYGVRAMFKLLIRYIQDYRLDTIAKIGSRWAPKAESALNNAWASNVARFSGIPMNARIDPRNFAQMAALARGIVAAENGSSYVDKFAAVMAQAWSMK